MTRARPTPEAPGDADLIAAVRGGDLAAYDLLGERHREAARRLARLIVPAADADALASDAFERVRTLLRRGAGPDVFFRAQLLAAVRRSGMDRLRDTAAHPGDTVRPQDTVRPDDSWSDPGVPFRDTPVEELQDAAVARAIAALPERWQLVLWHTEVEKERPARVAPLLGVGASAVPGLAGRAREGLLNAFVAQHGREVADNSCQWAHDHVVAYVRRRTSRRDAARVRGHLAECASCNDLRRELDQLNSHLGAVMAPLLLGGLAAGYLAGAGQDAGRRGAVGATYGRMRETAAAHVPATAAISTAGFVAAGLAAAALVGLLPGTTSEGDPSPETAQPESLASPGVPALPPPPTPSSEVPPSPGLPDQPFDPLPEGLPLVPDPPFTVPDDAYGGTGADYFGPGDNGPGDHGPGDFRPGNTGRGGPGQGSGPGDSRAGPSDDRRNSPSTGAPRATRRSAPAPEPRQTPSRTAGPHPTPSPTPSPTPGPTPGPEPSAAPSPTRTPTQSPSASPTCAPTEDLAVTSAWTAPDSTPPGATPPAADSRDATATVAGLAPCRSAVLRIEVTSAPGTDPEVQPRVQSDDPRCEETGKQGNALRCALAPQDEGKAVPFRVVGGPESSVQLTLSDDPGPEQTIELPWPEEAASSEPSASVDAPSASAN